MPTETPLTRHPLIAFDLGNLRHREKLCFDLLVSEGRAIKATAWYPHVTHGTGNSPYTVNGTFCAESRFAQKTVEN